MTEVYTLHRGTTPLLVSVPHVGTDIPPDIAEALQPRALLTEDADWFLDRLYAFAVALGASLIVPRYSRYVVDLNRPPENTPMYPGANNTELVPTRFFSGEPLYRDGMAPDDAEVARRVASYWRPYHDTLAAELARLQAEHGHATLFDGHSIQSELPWLFEGRLPDLNLGTASGTSCAPAQAAAAASVMDTCAAAPLAVPMLRSGRRPSNSQGISERMLCASHSSANPCWALRRASSAASAAW